MAATLTYAEPLDLSAVRHRTTTVDGLRLFYREAGFLTTRVHRPARLDAGARGRLDAPAQPLAWISARSRG
jgi:hypothetical protein